jgi:HKD family nuclease
MDRADRCDIVVAFLMDSGARLIVEHLRDFLARGGAARILVGDYLDVTEPAALRRLLDLDGRLTLRIHEARTTAFHLKSYMFTAGSEGIAFVGSSNLSAPALTTSIEWNYRVVSSHDVEGFRQIRDGFEALFADDAAVAVTPEWIAGYERRRRRPEPDEAGVPPEPPLPPQGFLPAMARPLRPAPRRSLQPSNLCITRL